ncbi:hypothetical protein FRC12_019218 [Ceratobasidium sp. 428]|nr:hypothetical protein FRC12_019218 [Ceratobasidium sp. 428]
MRYPETSIDFGKFIKRGEAAAWEEAAEVAEALALPAKPVEFLDLPTGDHSLTAVIDGQEKALIFKHAEQLEYKYRTPILELVDGVNSLQAHLPASTPWGLWVGDFATKMPIIFPRSPEDPMDGLQVMILFYAPITYFKASSQVESVIERFVFLRLVIEEFLVSSAKNVGEINPGGSVIV